MFRALVHMCKFSKNLLWHWLLELFLFILHSDCDVICLRRRSKVSYRCALQLSMVHCQNHCIWLISFSNLNNLVTHCYPIDGGHYSPGRDHHHDKFMDLQWSLLLRRHKQWEQNSSNIITEPLDPLIAGVKGFCLVCFPVCNIFKTELSSI